MTTAVSVAHHLMRHHRTCNTQRFFPSVQCVYGAHRWGLFTPTLTVAMNHRRNMHTVGFKTTLTTASSTNTSSPTSIQHKYDIHFQHYA
eukprot:4760977-Amphidinium_carterae.1